MVGMTRAHMADPHIARKIERPRGRDPPLRRHGLLHRLDLGGEARLHPQPGDRPRGGAAARRCPPRGRSGSRRGRGRPGRTRGGARRRRARTRGLGPRGRRRAGRPGPRHCGPQTPPQILGIVDWRVAECERHGVSIRYDSLAQAADVLAADPDVVVVATGRPAQHLLPQGRRRPRHQRLGHSDRHGQARGERDPLRRSRRASRHDGGEFIAGTGAKLEIVTPERALAPDIGGTATRPISRCFRDTA